MVSLCVISVLLSIRLAHSCIFHLCCLLPHFPLPHFQSPSFTPSVAIRCQIILCSLVSTASQWVIGILAALTNSLRSLSVSHVQLFRNMWAPVLPISSQRPPPYILVVENGRIIEISWGGPNSSAPAEIPLTCIITKHSCLSCHWLTMAYWKLIKKLRRKGTISALEELRDALYKKQIDFILLLYYNYFSL